MTTTDIIYSPPCRLGECCEWEGGDRAWAEDECLRKWWTIPAWTETIRFAVSRSKFPGAERMRRFGGDDGWWAFTDHAQTPIYFNWALDDIAGDVAGNSNDTLWLAVECLE